MHEQAFLVLDDAAIAVLQGAYRFLGSKRFVLHGWLSAFRAKKLVEYRQFLICQMLIMLLGACTHSCCSVESRLLPYFELQSFIPFDFLSQAVFVEGLKRAFYMESKVRS